MRILVTGGTVFVSRAAAEYFAAAGHEVTVLNRGSREQIPGVRHICRDRHDPALNLRGEGFDAVLDVTAYNARDIDALLDAVGDVARYIFISSSAVYPETLPQPFLEDMPVGPNVHWGAYGPDKIAAEQRLLARVPQAYVLRPTSTAPGTRYTGSPLCSSAQRTTVPFTCPGRGRCPCSSSMCAICAA